MTTQVTEEFLREAIQEVRNVMGYDTGHYDDATIMTAHGAIIGGIVQAKTAIWIQGGQMARENPSPIPWAGCD